MIKKPIDINYLLKGNKVIGERAAGRYHMESFSKRYNLIEENEIYDLS